MVQLRPETETKTHEAETAERERDWYEGTKKGMCTDAATQTVGSWVAAVENSQEGMRRGPQQPEPCPVPSIKAVSHALRCHASTALPCMHRPPMPASPHPTATQQADMRTSRSNDRRPQTRNSVPGAI